jgi:3-hydroxybutyryl-CoA dehydrogenase
MPKHTVGVVGAGTMGSSIAQLVAQNGFDVVLRDIDDEIVDDAVSTIRANLNEAAERGYIEDADAAFDRVHATTDLDTLIREATFVIEAASEEMNVKQAIFEELDEAFDEDVVLGTNTSALPITEIASSVDNPERVIGIHFFNPPIKMELVELITGYKTDEQTLEETQQLVNDIGKEPIIVNDFPGFASSRLGVLLGMEAARMVQQGVASAEDIDKAMELGYNHPMGPLKLGDFNGWDIRAGVAENLADELGMDVYRPPQNVKNMLRAGDLGKKSGKGFYEWDED